MRHQSGLPWRESSEEKREPVRIFAALIQERGLTQKRAAALLDIPQSKVSCLMNGRLSMFSLDHLFELLNALDRDVEIIIRPRTKEEKVATTHVFLATTP